MVSNEISVNEAYTLIKGAVIIFSMLAAGSCATGCGVAIGDSIQVSTVSWQREHNQGRLALAKARKATEQQPITEGE